MEIWNGQQFFLNRRLKRFGDLERKVEGCWSKKWIIWKNTDCSEQTGKTLSEMLRRNVEVQE